MRNGKKIEGGEFIERVGKIKKRGWKERNIRKKGKVWK